MTWLTVMEYLVSVWLITGFETRLTRRVSLVEQELLTLAEHLSSPPVFSGVRVTRSLVLYVCFKDRCLSFCTFSMAIMLSVLLRYTDSDHPFGIFKLFLLKKYNMLTNTGLIVLLPFFVVVINYCIVIVLGIYTSLHYKKLISLQNQYMTSITVNL